MSNNKNTKWILFFIFITIITALATVPKVFQNDTFYDIKIGEYIVSHGFLYSDPFSIHENLKYIPPHWLFDVLIYYIYKLFNFQGLYLFLLLWTCLLLLLLYITSLKVSSNKFISLFFSISAVYCLQDFLTVRTQIISYAIFIFEIYCIESFLRDGRKFWLGLLAILSIILINFHYGAWPFFFVIFLPYLANLVKIKVGRIISENIPMTKQLFIPIIIGIILGLINPAGPEGIFYSLKAVSNTIIMQNINEMLSPSFRSPMGISIFLVMAFVVFVYLTTKNSIKLHHFLMILGTTFMALQSVRHMALFVITTTIFITAYISEVISSYNFELSDLLPKLSKSKLVFLIIALSIPAMHLIKPDDFIDEQLYPVEAVEYIRQKLDKNDLRLYNQYSFGSYLILNDIKVFIDSRADLYTSIYNPGTKILEDYLNCDRIKVYHREIFDKYNLNYALVYADAPINIALSNDPGFTKIYDDESFILFKRNYK